MCSSFAVQRPSMALQGALRHQQHRGIYHFAAHDADAALCGLHGLHHGLCMLYSGSIGGEHGVHASYLCRVDSQLAGKSHAPCARRVTVQTLGVVCVHGDSINRRRQAGAARSHDQRHARRQQFAFVFLALHPSIDLEIQVPKCQPLNLGGRGHTR